MGFLYEYFMHYEHFTYPYISRINIWLCYRYTFSLTEWHSHTKILPGVCVRGVKKLNAWSQGAIHPHLQLYLLCRVEYIDQCLRCPKKRMLTGPNILGISHTWAMICAWLLTIKWPCVWLGEKSVKKLPTYLHTQNISKRFRQCKM